MLFSSKASKARKLEPDASAKEQEDSLLEQAEERLRKAEEDIQREIGGEIT